MTVTDVFAAAGGAVVQAREAWEAAKAFVESNRPDPGRPALCPHAPELRAARARGGQRDG
eukprot:9491013-Pyramimonas_sp.AAC.1